MPSIEITTTSNAHYIAEPTEVLTFVAGSHHRTWKAYRPIWNGKKAFITDVIIPDEGDTSYHLREMLEHYEVSLAQEQNERLNSFGRTP